MLLFLRASGSLLQIGGHPLLALRTCLLPEPVRVRVVPFGQQTVSLLHSPHKRIADAVLQSENIGNGVERKESYDDMFRLVLTANGGQTNTNTPPS